MRVSPGGGGSDAGACEDDGPGRSPGTTAVPPRLSVRFLARGRGGVLTARSAVTGPPVRFYWARALSDAARAVLPEGSPVMAGSLPSCNVHQQIWIKRNAAGPGIFPALAGIGRKSTGVWLCS